ncbi:hypothetical protein FGG08_003258 [Glutinoglossum americanum]|uniref:WKF domain-containing protein n=1 Tax=Glutinoglossum americanum TaxID=1670608 RepID=A0A9P8IDK9_9PEZI|nr:hypothetical protein FGG08_003258 [Glutinoglossum americanum]
MYPQLTIVGHGAQHVPAWRRIGLKLKFSENEVPGCVNGTTQIGRDDKKAKRTAREAAVGDLHSASPSKKSRLSALQPMATDPLVKLSRAPSSTSTHPPSSTPHLRKQKSVTFTPETKAEDGDSVKQLFNAWVSEQNAEDPGFQAGEIVKAFRFGVIHGEPDIGDNKRPQETQGQRRGKDGRTAHRPPRLASSMNGVHTHSAIVYLLDHHHSRDNWKFNKAKQSYLLKHLFDFDKIPADYNEALRDYIGGLQGQGARIRVREAAEKIKVEETGESAQVEGSIVDVGGKVLRAAWLLSALGDVGGDIAPAAGANGIVAGIDSRKGLKLDNELAESRGRKRKKRTFSGDSKESSDSSSSSSSSTEFSESDSSEGSSDESDSSSSFNSSNSSSSGSGGSGGSAHSNSEVGGSDDGRNSDSSSNGH